MSEPYILVDVSNLAYRSFFAMPNLRYEGVQTGMLFGFLTSVRMLQKLSPRIVFCWDYALPGQPTATPWRNALYPEYKAKRVRNPEAAVVIEQMPELLKVLQLLGYPNVAVPGLEADDIIGLLSQRPHEFLLFSTDDDLLQLLEGTRVRVVRREKSWRFITQQNVESLFGFPIERFPFYLALGGDKSDDIRPLPRCGPAGAQALVLAGVDPNAPYDQQPAGSVHKRFAEAWQQGSVRAAYCVAHIPRREKDWRVEMQIRAFPLPKSLNRNISSPISNTEEKFLQFCSKYGLLEIIAQRRKFFEPEANHEESLFTIPSRTPRRNYHQARP